MPLEGYREEIVAALDELIAQGLDGNAMYDELSARGHVAGEEGGEAEEGMPPEGMEDEMGMEGEMPPLPPEGDMGMGMAMGPPPEAGGEMMPPPESGNPGQDSRISAVQAALQFDKDKKDKAATEMGRV
tara:strand:- start:80 stop:466 length:387 start_codon:yes stop_codon:yes gene_type:complete